MIKFGNLTNPSRDIIVEINDIAKAGFDFVEIGIEGPWGLKEVLEPKIQRIKKEIAKNKLFAIAHTAWYLELGSPYETVRRAYIEEVKKEMILAKKLGCDVINVHSHCIGMFMRREESKNIMINNYIKSLRELVSYSKKAGIKLMLENAGESSEITRLKDIKKIMANVPGLYFHMDLGHMFIWEGMKGIEECFNHFKKKILHIHLHDNHGEKDEHLEIGKGRVNYNKVYRLLRKINYHGTITLEVFGKDRKPAIRSLKLLRKKLC